MDDMNRSRSRALLRRAKRVIPGGVNSPVRAYDAVGGSPPFIVRGRGARIFDVDGNEFIDYVALHATQGQTRWVPSTNNERHWRRRTPAPEPAPRGHDGRWRWMALDLDGAFRGEVLQSRLAGWEPFAELIENDEFREKLINRSADLMNTTLSLENALEVTDALGAEIAGDTSTLEDYTVLAKLRGDEE